MADETITSPGATTVSDGDGNTYEPDAYGRFSVPGPLAKQLLASGWHVWTPADAPVGVAIDTTSSASGQVLAAPTVPGDPPSWGSGGGGGLGFTAPLVNTDDTVSIDTSGATEGQVLTAPATPGDPPVWGGGSVGPWVPVASLPAGWTNVADAIGDPSIPVLATQDQGSAIGIRGRLAVSPAFAAAPEIGRLVLPGVIPVDQRPVSLDMNVPAYFAVLPDFSADPIPVLSMPALGFVNASGDLAFEVGSGPAAVPAAWQTVIYDAYGAAVAAATDVAGLQAAVADLVAAFDAPPTWADLFGSGGIWENAEPMSGGIIVLVVGGSYSLT